MKKDRANFISSSLETLLLAVIIGLLAATAAKTETSLNLNSLNGLFTPTQAERFFQAGREDFEREIEIFTHPERYQHDDLLQIDPESSDRLNEYQKPDNSQANYSDILLDKVP